MLESNNMLNQRPNRGFVSSSFQGNVQQNTNGIEPHDTGIYLAYESRQLKFQVSSFIIFTQFTEQIQLNIT